MTRRGPRINPSYMMELQGQEAMFSHMDLVPQTLAPPPGHDLGEIGHGQDDIPGEGISDLQRRTLPQAAHSDAEWLKMENHGLEDRHFADLSPETRRRYTKWFMEDEGDYSHWIDLRHLMSTPFNDYGHPQLFAVPTGKKAAPLWIPVSGAEAVILGLEHPFRVGSTAVEAAMQTELDMQIFGALTRPPVERWQVIDAYLQRVTRKRQAVHDLYDTMRFRDSDGRHMKSEERLELARKVRTHVLHSLIRTLAEYKGWDKQDPQAKKPHDTREVLQVMDYFMLHPEAGSQTFRKTRVLRPLFKAVDSYLEDVGKVFEARKAFAKKHPKHPVFRRTIELATEAALEHRAKLQYPRVSK